MKNGFRAQSPLDPRTDEAAKYAKRQVIQWHQPMIAIVFGPAAILQVGHSMLSVETVAVERSHVNHSEPVSTSSAVLLYCA